MSSPPIPPSAPSRLVPSSLVSPSLGAVFVTFMQVGLQAFGGGTSIWLRREIVVRRGWMEERAFLAGLALCQIAPGPNSLNLAMFIGTVLRGAAGGVAAASGLMLPPALIVVSAGAVYFAGHGGNVDVLLTGAGAAAIGLTFANAVQMARRGVRSLAGVVIALAVAVGVGLAHVGLLSAIALALPASWLLARREARTDGQDKAGDKAGPGAGPGAAPGDGGR